MTKFTPPPVVVPPATYKLELSEEEMVVLASLVGKVCGGTKFGSICSKLWDAGFEQFHEHKDYVHSFKDDTDGLKAP